MANEKSQTEQSLNLVWSWVVWIVTTIVTYGLLLLILAAVATKFGARGSWLPAMNVTELAILTGAFWLWRGGKL